MKSQSISYLINKNAHICWILNVDDEMHLIWILLTNTLQKCKGSFLWSRMGWAAVSGRDQKISKFSGGCPCPCPPPPGSWTCTTPAEKSKWELGCDKKRKQSTPNFKVAPRRRGSFHRWRGAVWRSQWHAKFWQSLELCHRHSQPKQQKFSHLLPLSTRQVPVPLTYYVRVRRQNAATHRLLVHASSLFVRLRLRIFSDLWHGAC